MSGAKPCVQCRGGLRRSRTYYTYCNRSPHPRTRQAVAQWLGNVSASPYLPPMCSGHIPCNTVELASTLDCAFGLCIQRYEGSERYFSHGCRRNNVALPPRGEAQPRGQDQEKPKQPCNSPTPKQPSRPSPPPAPATPAHSQSFPPHPSSTARPPVIPLMQCKYIMPVLPMKRKTDPRANAQPCSKHGFALSRLYPLGPD